MLSGVTVLLTTAHAVNYPGFVKCLRAGGKAKLRIIGTSHEKSAVGFVFVDKSHIVPPPDDVQYIDKILAVCLKEEVRVVIPLSPWELVAFAKNKGRFERDGIKLIISSLESLEITNSKYLLYEYCKKNSIPIPEFLKANSYEEFEKAVFKLGYPDREVCVKPTVSSGTRGFRILTSKVDRLNLLLSQQPDSTFTSFEELSLLLKEAKEFPRLLVMEYLPGDEYSVDILADKGKVLLVVPRLREKLLLGASFMGRVVEHEEISQYSERIASYLKLNGAVGTQFKLDREGLPKMLEVNARPHGALMLSAAAGVNILYLAIKIALGEKVTQPDIKWNTRMIRYYDEVYQDETGNFFRI